MRPTQKESNIVKSAFFSKKSIDFSHNSSILRLSLNLTEKIKTLTKGALEVKTTSKVYRNPVCTSTGFLIFCDEKSNN